MSSNICERNRTIEQFGSIHVELSFSFECNSDKCGNYQHYTDYLKYNAMSDFATGMGVTYVMCEIGEDSKPVRILGFVTLKASSLVTGGFGEQMDGYPAIEISELAVDRNYEGQGIGRTLLNYAVYVCDQIREEFIGVKYLIVCADPQAEEFYRKALNFEKVSSIYNIPREHWNGDCIPMFIKVSLP